MSEPTLNDVRVILERYKDEPVAPLSAFGGNLTPVQSMLVQACKRQLADPGAPDAWSAQHKPTEPLPHFGRKPRTPGLDQLLVPYRSRRKRRLRPEGREPRLEARRRLHELLIEPGHASTAVGVLLADLQEPLRIGGHASGVASSDLT